MPEALQQGLGHSASSHPQRLGAIVFTVGVGGGTIVFSVAQKGI